MDVNLYLLHLCRWMFNVIINSASNVQFLYLILFYVTGKDIFMSDKNSEYEFEETMVTLTDEDGNEKEFYIDEIYETDGRLYAAAIPAGVENITEYYVFRIKDLGNDDFEMEDITDEEEYDIAADAYEEKLDARLWNKINEEE